MPQLPADDNKDQRTKFRKKPKDKGERDYSKTLLGVFIPPVLTLVGVIVTGYFNYVKPPDAGAKPSVIQNIGTYIRIGTYVQAKALLDVSATPALLDSPMGERVGDLARHLSFSSGSEWSAGSAAVNRLIQFSFTLRATPKTPSENASLTFVLKRGGQVVCTSTLNTKMANVDGFSPLQQTQCQDAVPAGLNAKYVASVLSSNAAVTDVYADYVVARKL